MTAKEGRRRSPRRAFESPAGLLVAGVYKMEWALRLGESGMTIASSRPLAVGSYLVVNFTVPSGSVVIVRAVVRNATPAPSGPKLGEGDRYGIEFVNLGFQLKREIRNFVASAGVTGGFGAI